MSSKRGRCQHRLYPLPQYFVEFAKSEGSLLQYRPSSRNKEGADTEEGSIRKRGGCRRCVDTKKNTIQTREGYRKEVKKGEDTQKGQDKKGGDTQRRRYEKGVDTENGSTNPGGRTSRLMSPTRSASRTTNKFSYGARNIQGKIVRK